MFETSQSTAKLDAALAKAQGEIEAAEKSAANDAFKRNGKATRYADLTAVWDAIRPVMSKHGIAITQWPVHSEDGRLHLITRLAHDGEWMKCELSIPVTKADAHGFGSATTYAKRYGLAAAVGVVADEDDDGNGAAGKDRAGPHSPDKQITRDPHADTAQITGTPGAPKRLARNGYEELVNELRLCQTADACKEWLKLRKPDIDKLPEDWISHLDEEYGKHKESVSARAA